MSSESLPRHNSRVWLTPVLLGAFCLAFCLACLSFSRRYGYNVVDDALISAQYARHVAHGDGFVFNPGERVEGYTNFLWLVSLAALYWPLHWLGIDLVIGMIALNLVVAVCVLLLVGAVARRAQREPAGEGLQPWAAMLAVALCGLDNGFAVWTILGLETHFVAFWALLALWLGARSHGPAGALGVGLCLSCLVMTRPDAALFVVAYLGSRAFEVARRSGRDAARGQAVSLRWLGICVGVLAVIYGAYFGWRYHYFGYPLPNTFYLKASGLRREAWSRGVAYLRDFLAVRYAWPVLALTAWTALRKPLLRPLLGWALAHTAYIVHIGGDFYPGDRFFIALIPAYALLTVEQLSALERLVRRRFGWRAPPVLLAAACALALLALGRHGLRVGPLRTEIETWGPTMRNNRDFMRWLRDHKPAGASIVTGNIGTAGYDGEMWVHDFYGVIDPVIAHQPVVSFGAGKAGHEKQGTTDYFLAKQPTFLRLGFLQGDFEPHGYYVRADMPLTLGEAGIWQRDPLLTTGHFDEASAFHFDPGTLDGWQRKGNAFRHAPSKRAVPDQQPIEGQRGAFLSSFTRALGDEATGSMRSPEFTLSGDLLLLRVGGGHNPEKLRVELVVSGAEGERVVASFTGRDSEVLGRREIDIAKLRGERATIRVVDQAVGPWGHLLLDEIVQWSRTADAQ